MIHVCREMDEMAMMAVKMGIEMEMESLAKH